MSSSSPILSWKTRIILAIYTFAVNISRRPNLTVNRRLMSLFDPKTPPHSSPTLSVSDINFHNNLWLRLYTPITSSKTKLPLIVYFHGGGFAYFSADSKIYDDLCRRIAVELPAVVASINYRLAPEHKFPAQHDDGVAALRFIAGGECQLPETADRNNCFLSGDSAGGNIAHHVALRACNNDDPNVKIRGVIAMQPFFGGEERTESEIRVVGMPAADVGAADWMWKAWLPDGSDRDHPAANVFGPKSVDISGMNFPGALVFVGGFDPLQDWQRRYCQMLKRSGKEVRLVEYPNAIHGFYGMPNVPESDMFIDEVKIFLKDKCTKE